MNRLYVLVILLFFIFCNQPKEKDTESFYILGLRLSKVSLSGKAVKGEVKNANVFVYTLNSEGNCESQILGQSATDESGNYTVSYPKTGGNVCVSVVPKSTGETRIYDEKLGRDLEANDPSSFQLNHIVRESTFTDNRKVGIFISPFTKMIQSRVSALAKENPGSNVSALTRKASKELVIRFGLNQGLGSKSIGRKVSDEDYPELDEIADQLNDPSSSTNKKFQGFLAGFSQMAHQNKKGTSVDPSDLEGVVSAFANDMSNGKFDGVDSFGKAVLIGNSGKLLGANALSNQLLPAMKKFLQEGGKVGTSPTSSITIDLTELDSIQFVETAEIVSTVDLGITIPPTVSIGGIISGLTAEGLTLQNNGGDSLSVLSGSSSFTFNKPLISGSNYSVTLQNVPTGLSCAIFTASGTATSNVNTVDVRCRSISQTYEWGTFTDNLNGTVQFVGNAGTFGGFSYTAKTLIFLKCSQGQTWNSGTNNCDGTTLTYNYCNEQDNDCNDGVDIGILGSFSNNGTSESYSSCNSVSFAGKGAGSWRVPRKEELKLLIHCNSPSSMPELETAGCTTYTSPTISPLFPKSATTGFYWTATSKILTQSYAVAFEDGRIIQLFKDTPRRLRCLADP